MHKRTAIVLDSTDTIQYIGKMYGVRKWKILSVIF